MEPELTPLRLGDLLRRAREARGLTIPQVVRDTRIRLAYLEALESDDLGALPPPVYSRALVRSYAQYLNVDATEALELLNKEEQRAELAGVVPTVEAPRIAARSGNGLVRSVLILGLGISVGLAAFLLLPRFPALVGAVSEPVAPSPTPMIETLQAPAPVATLAPAPTATPAPPPTATAIPSPTLSPAARATATAAAAIRGVTVEARASGAVWAQAKADDQVVFAGILQPGEKRTWKGDRSIALHIGNAALLDVTYNGQHLGTLGGAEEVVKREWSSRR